MPERKGRSGGGSGCGQGSGLKREERADSPLLCGGVVFVAELVHADFHAVFAEHDVFAFHLLSAAVGELVGPEV